LDSKSYLIANAACILAEVAVGYFGYDIFDDSASGGTTPYGILANKFIKKAITLSLDVDMPDDVIDSQNKNV
jgi:hypothetical protein